MREWRDLGVEQDSNRPANVFRELPDSGHNFARCAMIGVAHIQSKNIRSRFNQLPQYIYFFRGRTERADDFGLTHDDHSSHRELMDRNEIARGAGLLQQIKMRHDFQRCRVARSVCFLSQLALSLFGQSRLLLDHFGSLAVKSFTSGSLPFFATKRILVNFRRKCREYSQTVRNRRFTLDWMPWVRAGPARVKKAIKHGRYSVCTISPHAQPRPYSRNQLRKSASCS